MLRTSPLAPAHKPPIPPRAGGGSRRRPEQALQRSVVEHLQWRARPNIWWTHIPLGGARSKIEAAIFKGLGARHGTPDLLLVPTARPTSSSSKPPAAASPPRKANAMPPCAPPAPKSRSSSVSMLHSNSLNSGNCYEDAAH